MKKMPKHSKEFLADCDDIVIWLKRNTSPYYQDNAIQVMTGLKRLWGMTDISLKIANNFIVPRIKYLRLYHKDGWRICSSPKGYWWGTPKEARENMERQGRRGKACLATVSKTKKNAGKAGQRKLRFKA